MHEERNPGSGIATTKTGFMLAIVTITCTHPPASPLAPHLNGE